jgi:putative tryptophan/tyrosine transport system ATP-binding protein
MLDGYALRKAFHPGTPNQRVALADVTLSLAAGDFAVVIGSNGAGKSTLLNAIAGEVRVDSGRIEIDGRDVTAEPTHRRAAAIARVFQDPSVGTAGPMTIEENLALAERRGARNGLRLGLSSSARRRYRSRLAAIGLGLEDRLGQKVELLSGGQRQSLALLMAVLTTPKLLLLDEPKTADVVMQATTQAVAHDRLTTLMVTHNMQHALDYGNRLIMMNEGRIVFAAQAGEKAALTVERLVQRFHLASDRMLLG